MKRWFSPQLVGLHLLAVVVVAACVLMGLWQLGVYGQKHDDSAARARHQPAVPLLQVWGPDDPFTAKLLDRPVRIRGDIDAKTFFKVPRPDGRPWLAATIPVRGTKSAIVVVLGHFPSPSLPDWPSPRPTTFTATLQPAEPSGGLSIAERVNHSHIDLFSGYALAVDPMLAEVTPVPPPEPNVSWTVGLRNLAYALQWWIFGLFTVFMWWRMCTDAVAIDKAAAESVADASLT